MRAARVILAAIVNDSPRNWKRLVLKCGTSSLTDDSGRISLPKLWAIGRGVQLLKDKLGCHVVIVSSGAGAAGRERLGLKLPLTLPDKQAAAAVGQALLMLDWARALAPLPVAQLLLTASDVQDRERYVNARNTIEASLRLGAVPVINENDSVATSEIRLGDNDTLSAWTAYLADADALVILTDVEGLYDRDPGRFSDARRIDTVTDLNEVRHLAQGTRDQRGTGGMVTKLRAAEIATQAGIETLVIGGGGAGLEALAEGTVRGTRFRARPHAPRRKAWLAQQPTRGQLTIDAGALNALKKGSSLLAIGITAVQGTFRFGDAVDIINGGTLIARGLSNFDSDAATRIKGQRSSEFRRILGNRDFDEVVHRDNLVLVRP